jgi:hypothetical protein
MKELENLFAEMYAEDDAFHAEKAAQEATERSQREIAEARAFLVRPLAETQPPARDKMCHVLLGIGTPEAIESLRVFFTDNPTDLRQTVAYKLFDKVASNGKFVEFAAEVVKRNLRVALQVSARKGKLDGSDYEAAVIAFLAMKAFFPKAMGEASERLKRNLKGNLPRAICEVVATCASAENGGDSKNLESSMSSVLPVRSRSEQEPLQGNVMASQLRAMKTSN